MKTEYMTETQTTKKAIWLHCFLTEIDVFYDDVIIIQVNNNETMNLARNSEFYACTKHIDIQYHFICETIDCYLVDFKFMSTAEQAVNELIKTLFTVKFNCFLVQSELILN